MILKGEKGVLVQLVIKMGKIKWNTIVKNKALSDFLYVDEKEEDE